jgi:hypothetical protein
MSLTSLKGFGSATLHKPIAGLNHRQSQSLEPLLARRIHGLDLENTCDETTDA